MHVSKAIELFEKRLQNNADQLSVVEQSLRGRSPSIED